MSTQQYPEEVLVPLDTLLSLRFQASSTFNKTFKKSSAIMAGNYASPFRGRGIDFSEVRMYEPGDDVRTIDWRVTARTGKAHTKLFIEERERPVFFIVDCNSSMQFGTQVAFKSVIAAKIMALLAWSAVAHGDRVGGMLFSEAGHEEVKPSGGKRGILKLFSRLVEKNRRQLEAQQFQKADNFQEILFLLRRVVRPGSLVYFISDFNQLTANDIPLISQLARHCDLALFHVYDVLEKVAPPTGQYRVSNGKETGIINVDKKNFQHMIGQLFNQRIKLLEILRKQHGIQHFSVATTDDVPQVVRNHLNHKIHKTVSP
ncbi:MAG: DUF58 domain-containing protein [Gammaproteobacteria bacterium]|nr:DUF58 domain-containing protein [Gammaproteobacteria bacterium]